MVLEPGTRVRGGAMGPTFNRSGAIVTAPEWGLNDRGSDVWVRWDESLQPTGYRMDSEVIEQLQRMVRCGGRDAKLQPIGLSTCLRKSEHGPHEV